MLTQTLPILSLALNDFRDSTTFVLSDSSTYATIPTSSQVALVITPPGLPSLNVLFTPGSINIYKCVDLGITCNDSGCTPLPDGIYDVAYTVILPDTTTTSIDLKVVKIDQIRCAYQHAFLALDLGCDCHDCSDRPYMKELKRAKLYIDGCVAECNRGNYKLSFDYYQKAEYILNNLACKFAGLCKGNRGQWGCGCK